MGILVRRVTYDAVGWIGGVLGACVSLGSLAGMLVAMGRRQQEEGRRQQEQVEFRGRYNELAKETRERHVAAETIITRLSEGLAVVNARLAHLEHEKRDAP